LCKKKIKHNHASRDGVLKVAGVKEISLQGAQEEGKRKAREEGWLKKKLRTNSRLNFRKRRKEGALKRQKRKKTASQEKPTKRGKEKRN